MPYQIYTALNSTSLLFVVYGLRDINFRFIFRGLMHLLGEGLGSGLQLPSIAVQLPSGFTEAKKSRRSGIWTIIQKHVQGTRLLGKH